MRGRATLLAGLAMALTAMPLVASAVPTPDPNAVTTVLPRPCVADPGNPYEAEQAEREGWQGPEYERYPGHCQQLRFAFGPIAVKPGQNDVLVEPVVIDKPQYDGYITRIKPDLVYEDGTVPPIEQVHLHHATWLSVPTYGSGPFFAAGEEKTIAFFPRGYGMPVRATDQWLLLYMVHSAIPEPKTVYITYEVDFIPKQAAEEELGLQPVYPIWLDVETGGYPVFNTQRAYGGDDGVCTYPAEQCASFDPWGDTRPSQGEPPAAPGAHFDFPAAGGSLGLVDDFRGGTIVGIGGHLHPGGLTNDIDLVRGDQVQRVYTGQARYWDRDDSSRWGGPPTSWDFSMTVTGLPRWGIRVEPGDRLRSNATYDTTRMSTYENMGIAIALLAPDGADGTPSAPGVDPFAVPFDDSDECASGGLQADVPTLCDKGSPTHGHLAENDNFGGPDGRAALTDKRTPGNWNRVDMAGFLYNPGDLSTVEMTGLPTVPLGSQLRFTNEDTLLGIFHTATSCAYPCTGATGTAFPLADGATSTGRSLDFDSGELGYGVPYITGAKNEISWDLDVTPENGFEAGEVVTYYCRIHPFMRAGFEVVE